MEIWGATINPETLEGILRTIWTWPRDTGIRRREGLLQTRRYSGKEYFSSLGVPVIDDLACPRAIRGVFRVIIHGQAGSVEVIGEDVSAA
jgi:hypothetical protein